MSSTSAIFINSMWRSGGTYWWGKYRHKEECYCYYEPFHEDLAIKSASDFLREFDTGITKALRHTNIDKSYFAEYPFDEDWFRTFHRNFSVYNEYFLENDSNGQSLQDYLARLIAHAQVKKRIPVFKMVRASFRTAAFATQFDAVNLYILRRFDEQFESTVLLNGLSPLFQIIKYNRTNRFFTELYDFLNREQPAALARDARGIPRFASRRQFELYRSVLFFFWALSLLYNLKYADLIINHEHIEDRKYRKHIADHLRDLVGISLDLEDFRTMRRSRMPIAKVLPEVLDIIKKKAKSLNIDKSKLKNSSIAKENLRDIELALG